MAINPNIPLQTTTIDPSQGINRLAQAKMYSQERKEKQEDRAQRSELIELQIAGETYKQLDERAKRRLESTVLGAARVNQFLETGDVEGATAYLQARRSEAAQQQQMFPDLPMDTVETDAALKLIQSGEIDRLMATTSGLMKFGQYAGILNRDATTGEFETVMVGGKPVQRNTATGEERASPRPSTQLPLEERKFQAEEERRRRKEEEEALEAAEQAAAQQAQGAVDLDAFNTSFQRATGVLDTAIAEGFEVFGDEVTRISGSVASLVPGSDRSVLEGALDTMKGLIGFSKLQKMRESSPTGGALGQVSELELRLLNSTLGNIDPAKVKNAADLKRQLEVVQKLFARVVGGTAATREEHLQNIRQMADQQEIQSLSNEELLRF